MEKEELKELSTEALSKKLSTQKTFGGLMLSASLAILVLLWDKARKTGEFNYLELIIPLCCFASLPFLWKELKAIKVEIESRK